MTVGKAIRIARSRAGFTQDELAEQAGLSIHTVNMVEAGRQRPIARTIGKLARALGLDVEELLDLADRDGGRAA